jgi:hypothetical protein
MSNINPLVRAARPLPRPSHGRRLPRGSALLLAMAFQGSVAADTFVVEPGPAEAIQQLIDSVVAAGDVVVLAAGDHLVTTVVDLRGRAIELRGEIGKSGEPLARLVGQGLTGVLVCRTGETTGTRIRDLVVTGGDIDLGAGLLVNNASPSVSGVRFESNRASVFGGGVGVFGAASSPVFESCAFIDNRAELVGGGCLNGTDAFPVYRGCVWIGNECGLYGRAMYNQIDSNPTLQDTTVEGCCEVVPPQSFIDDGGNAIEPTCDDCRGDLNCYQGVGSADIGLLLGAWGTTLASYDLDGDGIVGGSDIGVLVSQWGACPD